MKKSTRRKLGKRRERILLQSLEDRVLFSVTPSGVEHLLDGAHATDAASTIHTATPSTAHDQIVFVDTGVEGHEQLTDLLRASAGDSVRIIELDANRDGLEQVADALRGYQDVSAIHILSHGNAARLQLGNAQITNSDLASYESVLSRIGDSLADDGDILIYGCDLAGNAEGQQFLQTMRGLTGADVAASTDVTGAESLGGDWVLEASSGDIETTALSATAWQSTLVGPADVTWLTGSGPTTQIDFSSGSPVVSESNANGVQHGFASYTDPATGELILYTNGRTVWNGQTGAVLSNGTGLNGSVNASHPAAIVPVPGERDQFYIFTNSFVTSGNISFSRADMSLGTQGEIIQKNVFITSSEEGMDVVPHANGTDFWLLTFGVESFPNAITIEARHYDSTGVAAFVETDTSLTFSIAGAADSFITHSPDNSKILYGAVAPGQIETGDFDNATGLVSNIVQHLNGADIGYAGAFSPDGTKFYYTVGASGISGTPHQYDISTSTATELSTETGHGGPALGPDGRIYFAKFGESAMSVVNSPNSAGLAANFVHEGLDLTNGGAIPGANSSSNAQNVVATPPSLANAPLLSLDADDAVGNLQTSIPRFSTIGAAIVDSDGSLTDPDSIDLSTVQITAVGIDDGNSEVLTIGGRAFQLGTTATQTSDLIGGTTFDIAYDDLTGVFGITNNGGGNMPLADVETLLKSANYVNNLASPTSGDREFRFLVNDGTHNERATATVSLGPQIMNTLDVTGTQRHTRLAALASGGYIATWVSTGGFDGSGSGIVGQLFDSSGGPVGSNFVINEFGDATQDFHDVTALAAGGFAVTYQSNSLNDTDLSGYGTALRLFDDNGNALGGEILANTETSSNQQDPSIAQLTDGSIVVAWESANQDRSQNGVYAQRFDAAGTKVGAEFRVSTSNTLAQENVMVEPLSGGGFVMVWEDAAADIEADGGTGRGIFAQTFDAAGNRVGQQLQVGSFIEGSQTEPAVAGVGDGFVVVWQGIGQGENDGVFMRRFDANGNAIGNETVISGSPATNDQQRPRITTLNDGSFIVAWNDVDDQNVLGRRFNLNGQPISAEMVFNDPGIGQKVGPDLVQLNTGLLAVGWQAGFEVVKQEYVLVDPITPSIVDLETTSAAGVNHTHYPSDGSVITVDDGADATIADFGSTDLNGGSLTVTITNAVVAEDLLGLLNQGSGAGQIGISGSNVQFGGATIGTLTGGGASPLVVSFTTTPTQQAVEALIRVVTYQNTETTTPDFSIREVQFDLADSTSTLTQATAKISLSPLQQEFLVNSSITAADQIARDAVKLTNGNLVIAWDGDVGDGQIKTVLGRIYSSDGNPLSDAFILNEHRDSDQDFLRLAFLQGGGFVATWDTNTALDTETSGTGIAGRVFDASGNVVVEEFVVNTHQTNFQTRPDAIGLQGGGFVIAWDGPHPSDATGVSAQIFDASAVPVGSQIEINTVISGSQQSPRLAALDNGDFVAAWYNNGNISYRRFGSDGTPLDTDELVASADPGTQSRPTIAAFNGGFAIAWGGQNPDDSAGIRMQRFGNDGVALAAESVLVNETTNGTQADPELVSIGEAIAVAWSGEGADDTEGIWLRLYTKDGEVTTSETRVNTTVASTQETPVIAPTSTFGEFVLAWSTNQTTADNAGNDDFEDNGVFARIIDMDIKGEIDLDADDSSGVSNLDFDTRFMETETSAKIADTDVTIETVEDATFTQLELTVSGLLDAGNEFLHFGGQSFDLSVDVAVPQTVTINANNYDVTYDSASGVMTIALNGGAEMSIAQLTDVALDGEYSNSGSPPTEGARTIEWVSNEGNAITQVSTTTVNVFQFNQAPVITADASTPYLQGEPAVIVDSSLPITDADDTHLEGAIVTVPDIDRALDLLTLDAAASAAASSAGITVTAYNPLNGQLRLDGNATLAEYQAVLEGVQFSSFSPVLGDRAIEFVVDGLRSGSAPSAATIVYTTDAVPPNDPVSPLNMLASSDTGIDDADNYTSVTSPDFNIPPGEGTVGDTINIYIDSVLVDSFPVAADGGGAWTPSTPFADGTYSMTYSFSDPVGNESGQAPAIDVTVDTSVPTGSLFVNALVTNDSTPTITGNGFIVANEYLQVEFEGGVQIYTTSGFWQYTQPTPLADGTYTATVHKFDLAGNFASHSADITIDTVVPQVPTVNPLTTDDRTPLLTGDAVMDIANDELRVTVDGRTYFSFLGDLTFDGLTWSLQVENDITPDGTYEVIAVIEDPAGNESFDTTVGELVIDSNEPAVPIVHLQTTNDNTPAITGTSILEVNETLEVTVNGVTYTTIGGDISFVGTTWTLVIPGANTLPDGTYEVTATARNTVLGTSSTDETNDELKIDTVSPVVPTVDTQTTADTTPLITGTATVLPDETFEVLVDSIIYFESGPHLTYDDLLNTWSLQIPAGFEIEPSGTYEVVATVEDEANNQSVDVTAGELIIDTVAPAIPTINADATNDTTPVILGSASLAADETLSVEVNGVTYLLGDGQLGISGNTWSLQIPSTDALPDGTYEVIATASDSAGNSTTDTTNDELIVDTVDPAIPTVDFLTTDQFTPLITGTAVIAADEQLRVRANGFTYLESNPNLTVTGNTWALQIPPELAYSSNGTYEIEARIVDLAENTSLDTTNLELTIDTMAPDPPIVQFAAINDTTPAITGTANLLPDETLTVEVDGVVYTLGDGNLSMIGTTWTLTVPFGNEMAEGTYDVIATASDSEGNSTPDNTVDEIIIDITPPDAPTVNSQTTNDSTPFITGSLTLLPGEVFAVSVNGDKYFTFQADLTVTASAWSLQIPQVNELTVNDVYEVVAEITDPAGNVVFDTTTGELTYDNVQPNAPVVTPLETNDTTPAITGTAQLGVDDSLSVEVDGVVYTLGDGDLSIVGEDWTLVVPPGNELPEGTLEVLAVAFDSAGNSNPDATTDELVIDTTPPATPTVDFQTTNNPTPTITGTAVVLPNETFRVVLDGNIYNETGLNLTLAGTAWTLIVPPPFAITTDGVYDVQAIVEDSSGNQATDATVGEFTLDTLLPDQPTVDFLATPDTTPAITGTATLAADETLTVELDGTTYTMGDGNLTLVGSDWTLVVPTPLAEGTYEVVARVIDALGNENVDPDTNDLIIDNTPPAIPTVDAQVSSDPTPTITGTAVVGVNEALEVEIDGNIYFEAGGDLGRSGTAWTLQVPGAFPITPDGVYEVEARVIDIAGNTSVDTTVGEFTLDSVLPNAPTVDQLFTTDTTPAITGTASLAADETLTVEVNGVTYNLGDGNLGITGSAWTLVIPAANVLPENTYDVHAVVTDSVGNSNADPSTNELKVDLTPPAVPTVDPLTTSDPTPFLTGTATVVGDEFLEVTIDGIIYVQGDGNLTVTGTTWSLQVPSFRQLTVGGTYDVQAVVADLAGNVTPDATVGELIFNLDLPDAPVVTPLATNDPTPVITGTANLEADETLTVTVDSIPYALGDGNLGISGSDWTLQIPAINTLAEGIYEVQATASDSVGNINSDVTTDELEIDLTPPATPTVDPLATNDSTPLITGTAILDPTDALVVRVNGTNYFDFESHLTVAGANWSLQIPTILEFTVNGTYDVEVTVTDVAGNVANDATVGEFIYDTTLPDAPVVNPLATNDSTPAITGTANLAADETLSVTVAGVTYNQGDGNLSLSGADWTLVIPAGNALGEATYEVLATTTDSLGNASSDVTTNELLIDLTPPATPTVDPLVSNDPTPFLTGTAAAQPGEVLTVSVNGNTYDGLSGHLTLAGSNWSLQIPAGLEFTSDGDYDVQAVLTDPAGNTAGDVTLNEFTYDTTLPDAPTVDPLATNDTTPAITGTVNLAADETLTVEVNGVTYTPGDGSLSLAGSNWSLVIPAGNALPEGIYEVNAVNTDSIGNANLDATTNELTIDLTPPAVPTVDPLVDNDPTPLLTGTATVLADETLAVTVNGNTYFDGDGFLVLAGPNWSLQIPTLFEFTSDGVYDVDAVTTDLAGNASADITLGEFTYDTALPDAPLVDPLATNDQTPVITGTANLAADETLTVEVDSVVYSQGGGNLSVVGSDWTLSIPNGNDLLEGTYDVTATATDSIGNANIDVTADELIIDLTPPATPTVDPLITNDPTPLITGTGVLAANDELTVVVNGVTYFVGDGHLASAGPNWSLQIPNVDQFTIDGTYDVDAVITDLAGNAAPDLTSGEFIYDTVLPDAPTVDLLATNDQTPTITGTATLAADENLTVSVNGTTYIPGDGNLSISGTDWTLVIPAIDSLPEATYEVVAVATDSIGNSNSDATTDELIIDLTPPAVPTVDPQTTNDPTPLITGTTTLGAGELISVTVNGVTYVDGDGNLSVTGSNWTLQIPTGTQFTVDGTYNVDVTVTDLAGNTSADPTSGEFTYDTALPATPTVDPLATNNNEPTLIGTATLAADENLTVTVNGVTYSAGDGNLSLVASDWTLAIPNTETLPDGTYEVEARVVDSLGNTSLDGTTDELLVDTTPPAIPTVNSQISNDSTPLITGTANLGAGESLTVTFNGITYFDGDGNLSLAGTDWSLQIPGADALPADGVYSVDALATDLVGNSSADPTVNEFTLDTVPPAAPTVDPLLTNDTTPAITGTATLAADETLTVDINGVTYSLGDGNLSIVGNAWTLQIPGADALPEGIYEVTATVTDSIGNATADVTLNELEIDTTPPPTPTVVSQVSNDNTPFITGTAVVGAGDLFSVTVNGVTYLEGDGNLTLTGTTWSLQIPPGDAFTADGVYEVDATIIDAAGNSSTDAATGDFTLDTTPPPAPTVDALLTNNPTPAITGTAALGAGETLEVVVDGVTYTLGDGNLSIVGNAWTLVIPNGNDLVEGIYDVDATAIDAAGNSSTDASANEVEIDLTAPTVPTVTPLIANDPTPVMSGTAVVGAGETLTVEANGVIYSVGDGNLTLTGSTWSLQIPPGGAFPGNGTYDITAVVVDAAGNTSTDATSGEFTLDTSLPDTPVVNPLATSNTTPTITGTANLAADESLTVAVDGVIYTVGDGNLSLAGSDWTLVIPPGNALSEGTYDVVATSTDSLGNAATDGTIGELDIDLTPPATPTVDLLTANDPTPVLTGTATVVVGESLTVEANGDTFVEGDGNLTLTGTTWALQVPAGSAFAADGTYDITATVTDPAGNSATDVTSGEFTLDTVLPAAPTVNSLLTNDTSPSITGTATLAADETLLVEVNGVTYSLGDGNLSIAGTDWSLTIPPVDAMPEGTYEVNATAIDSLTNANSDVTSNELEIDLTPPPTPAVDTTASNSPTPTLTGTAIVGAGDTFTVELNGVTYTPGDGNLTRTGSNWTLVVPPGDALPTDGVYDINATVTDAAGNSSVDTTSGEFTLDRVPPPAPTVDPLLTNNTTPAITGTATLAPGDSLAVNVDGATYNLGDGNLSIAGNVWTLVVPPGNALAEGIYEVSASASDPLGNTSTDGSANELEVDLTAPSVPTVTSQIANDATPTITGTAVLAPGDVFTVTTNGVTYTVGDGNLSLVGSNWTLQIPAGNAYPADGTYDVDAQITDPATNVSIDATSGEFTLDTVLPSAPTVNPLLTNSVTPTVTGTAILAADETLTVTVDGVTYTNGDGNLSVSGSNWTLSIPAGNALAEGTFEVVARTTDSLGNTITDASANELQVDLTPPVAPNVDPLISNDLTPLLTGTVNLAPGDSFSVVVDGVTYTDGDGNLSVTGSTWNLQIPNGNELTPGTYDIDATVTDAAGNVSTDPTSAEFTLDTTPPATPTVDSQLTNNATPTVTGTAVLAADETLAIDVNGTTYLQGDGNLSVTGSTWSLAIPSADAITDGTYDVAVTSTDSLGNFATDATVDELVVDLTPPTVPTVDPHIANDPTPTMTGTATLLAGESLTVQTNGTTYTVGDGHLSLSGNVWTLQIPTTNAYVTDGTYDVTAQATDAAGNVSTDTTVGEFTLDRVPPATPVVTPLATNDTTPVITGTATLAADESLTVDVDGVTYTQGDGNLSVNGSTWSLQIPTVNFVLDGVYDVSATATDSLGNVATDVTSSELTIDTTPPATPTVNTLTSSDPTPQLSGTALLASGDSLAVEVNGATFAPGDGNLVLSGATWLLQVPAASAFPTDGSYEVTARTFDPVGNTATDTTANEFTLDTALPNVPTVNPLLTNNTTPTISGSANVAVDETLTVTVDGITYSVGDGHLSLAGTSWTLAIPPANALAEGTHEVTATLTDSLGNANSDTTTGEVVIDTTPPPAPTVNGLSANDPTPLITGTANLGPGDSLTVTANGTTYTPGDGNLTVSGPNWSLQIPPSGAFPSDGTYDITATTTDALGNSATDTSTNDFVLNSALPNTPTVNGQLTNDPTPTITGTANLNPGDSLIVVVDGSTYNVGDGNLSIVGTDWSLLIPPTNPLSEGTYNVSASVVNGSGVASDPTVNEVVIDATPPQAPTVNPATVTTATPTLSGTAVLAPNESLSVEVDGVVYNLGDGNLSVAGSNWTLSVPTANSLADGTYDVIATAVDIFGNASSDPTANELTVNLASVPGGPNNPAGFVFDAINDFGDEDAPTSTTGFGDGPGTGVGIGNGQGPFDFASDIPATLSPSGGTTLISLLSPAPHSFVADTLALAAGTANIDFNTIYGGDQYNLGTSVTDVGFSRDLLGGYGVGLRPAQASFEANATGPMKRIFDPVMQPQQYFFRVSSVTRILLEQPAKVLHSMHVANANPLQLGLPQLDWVDL